MKREHWRLLVVLGAISLVEGYDLNILTIALPQLRASFHLSQAQGSWWLAAIYLGAVPAFLLARRADRLGRRRLLLLSILCYTAATLLTAGAPTIVIFGACQFASRLFLTAKVTLTWTVAAEELPASHRGLGFGWLAGGNAVGTGLAAMLWGAVLSPSGVSWRWLYGGGAALLFVVLLVWRRLPETTRFAQVATEGKLSDSWSDILRPVYRGRLAALVLSGILINLTVVAAVFVIDFMETQRHLSATAANLILIAAGAVALPVLLVAGNLSDRFGRKRVACIFLVIAGLGPIIFFSIAHGALELFLALGGMYIGAFGAWPTANSFGSEIFPTRLRALGGSIGNVSRMVGQSAGFALGAAFIGLTSALPRAVDLLCIGPFIGAVILAFAFPETSRRELETITLATEQTDPTPASRQHQDFDAHETGGF